MDVFNNDNHPLWIISCAPSCCPHWLQALSVDPLGTPWCRETLAPLTSEALKAEGDEVILPEGHTWVSGDIRSDPTLNRSARLPAF